MSSARLVLAALLIVVAIGGHAYAETKIAALGASNVAGWKVSRAAAFPAQLEAKLRKSGHDVRVVNAGVSWDTSLKMLQRIQTDVSGDASIVIPAENVRQVTNELMPEIERRLQQRGIAVLRVNFRGVPRNLLQQDGIHLTAKGHSYFADQLVQQIAPMIKRQQAR